MKILKQDKRDISKIVTALKNGEVLILPTDTVYGFICDATNKKAVGKIYKIKKRPKLKPLPIFVRDFKMAKDFAKIDEKQTKTLKAKWPGKYTFVLNKRKGVNIYGVAKATIALRIPRCKFLNNLLRKINKPLAQTSANISGQPPLAKISDIIKQLGNLDILVIDAGNLKKSKPSKIIDLTNNNIKIIRN